MSVKTAMPCEHLRFDGAGARCDIYGHHHGWHQLIDGTRFECVPVQREIEDHGGRNGCGYVEEIQQIRAAIQ